MASTRTLQQTINWAKTFVQYSPLTAGLGNEPAVSIASMIRNTMLNPPQTWYFNRNTVTFTTTAGTQDYTQTVADLSFVEKVSLTDDKGNIYEIKDVYNNTALSPSSTQQRPTAMSVMSLSGTSFQFRFLGVPDAVYTVTIAYQKVATQFGPFFITSVANAVAGNTTYTGVFDPLSFAASSTAVVSGCAVSANNGSFTVVSCNSTTLVLANAAGATDTAGYVSNFSWSPIPDQYSDVYNNLFLSEILALTDDQPRAQLYRQRGVAAYLAKATGLTEMQKNIFVQQWLARDMERASVGQITNIGNTARGV